MHQTATALLRILHTLLPHSLTSITDCRDTPGTSNIATAVVAELEECKSGVGESGSRHDDDSSMVPPFLFSGASFFHTQTHTYSHKHSLDHHKALRRNSLSLVVGRLRMVTMEPHGENI